MGSVIKMPSKTEYKPKMIEQGSLLDIVKHHEIVEVYEVGYVGGRQQRYLAVLADEATGDGCDIGFYHYGFEDETYYLDMIFEESWDFRDTLAAFLQMDERFREVMKEFGEINYCMACRDQNQQNSEY